MNEIIERCTCGEPALQGQTLCWNHRKQQLEDEFLDNSDINNLGIIKYAKYFFPDYTRDATPEMHKQFYWLFLEMYNPLYLSKYERQRNIVSWRGSAKSTVINLIISSYVILFNGKTFKLTINDEVQNCLIFERFIVLLSETGSAAEEYAVRLRDELTTNEKITFWYRLMIEDAYDAIDGQMTRKAFKMNNTWFLSLGARQQIRGRIKGAYRPTLLLPDDIYSENNIITDQSRRKIRKWWNAAVINTVDDKLGKVMFTGTILHEDTVNYDFCSSKSWRTVKFELMPIIKFRKFIKEHLKINEFTSHVVFPFDDVKNETERIIKQREYFINVQKGYDWELSWPERLGLYDLALQYREKYETNQISLLYQEHFHELADDNTKGFKSSMFQRAGSFSIINKYGENWILWDKYINTNFFSKNCGQPIPKRINIEIGVDMGGSDVDDDPTVITVKGMLPDKRGITIKQIIGKFGQRDEVDPQISKEMRWDKIITDRSFIRKTGYIDEVFRTAIEYNVETIKIGVAGEEKSILNEFRRVADMIDWKGIILPRAQTSNMGDKRERIVRSIQGRYQTMMEYHAEGLEALEHQLEFIHSTKKDDCADSAEVASYRLEPPVDIGMEFYEKPVGISIQSSVLDRINKALIPDSAPDWWKSN